ncbi:MAG: hypothetical protein LC115_06295 [Bacteroidia bacterium]|nr:hypothetical protein [Bacteroidia bacterium]
MSNNPPLTLQEAWLRVWFRRKYVIVTVLISALLAVIFSLPWFVTPKYKASAEFIPPNFASIKQLNFKESQQVGFGIGGNDDADRCVAILTAASARKAVSEKFQWIQQFGLSHYPLDKQDKIIEGVFDGDIDVRTTPASSIVVSVFNIDSTQAAATANFLVTYLDSLLETFAGRKTSILAIQPTLAELKEQKQAILDTLAGIRKRYKIYHTELGSEDYMKKTLPGMVDSPEAHQIYDNLVSLERRLYIVDGEIALLEREKERIEIHLKAFPTILNIYQQASVPHYISRPQRLLIVMGTCISVLLVLVLAIVFLDKNPH